MEDARFWVRGVVASAALHLVVAMVLFVSVLHEGDPLARDRLSDVSTLTTQVVLLNDTLEPRHQSPMLAPRPQPAEPLSATVPNAVTPAHTLAVLASTATLTPSSPATSAVSSANPSVDLAALGSDYRRRLLDHIAAHRSTPPAGAAVGRVYVNFSLLRGGEVQSVAITVSSGDTVLDRVAIESIQSANPMPVIPPAFPDRLSVTLPIDFGRSDQAKVLARP